MTIKRIAIAKQFHDELKTIVEDIEDLFAVPILLSLTVNFVNMVSSVNMMYLVVTIFSQWSWALELMSMIHFLVLFSNIVEFIFISTACGNVSNEVLLLEF